MAAMISGAFGGVIFAPQPAGAVSKEMIQLQQQVQQLLQGQQDMRSAIDTNNASMKTLVQQSLDTANQLNSKMGLLEQTVQQVQANTGSRIDTMTQQSQGVSDNLQDMQARVAKLAQQLTDIQNTLQSIDAKVSNSAPAPTSGGTNPTSMAPVTGSPDPASAPAPTSGHAMPPISADTLYQNALRDYTTGKYDMSRQEFSDYVKNFPTDDLAGNAQFYLGEIAYAQSNYPDAISQYEIVLTNYPKSFKLEASLLKKGMAEIQLGKKQAGIKDLQQVVKRFPGSDESKRAQAKLHDLGAPIRPAAAH
jgi:tol-pal system protein YbgF